MLALPSLALLALLSLSAAAPAPPPPSPFLLVTTPQSTCTSCSSTLANVSATSLFDPYYQPNLLLRLTGPGYGSLPNFTLTSGVLHTLASPAHSFTTEVYNSSAVVAGQDLSFAAAEESKGGLEIKKGCLLAVGGETKGWSVCAGDLGQQVIVWQGADASCTPTYVHAVADAPY